MTANSIPRRAYLPKVGKVRVLEYVGQGRFTVIDSRDTIRLVPRDRLRFCKS